jgi:hypothetical protein
MRGWGAILILTLLLSACAGGAGALSAAPTAPPVVLSSGSLKVTLTGPADETVVNTPQVDVTGQAPAETVISIGDVITVVEASGEFSIRVPLEEGPNELEIIASDPNGNQVTTTLVVTYEPGS